MMMMMVCVTQNIYFFYFFRTGGGYPPPHTYWGILGYMGFLVFFGVFGCPREYCYRGYMVFGLASGNVQAVVYGVYIFLWGVKMGVL